MLFVVVALMKDREILILLLDTVFVDNNRISRDIHRLTVVIFVNNLVPVFVLFNPVSTDKQSAALKEKDAVQSFMLIYRQPENC